MKREMVYQIIVPIIIAFIVLSFIYSPPLRANSSNQVIFRIGWGGTSFDTFNPFTSIAQISLWSTSDVYDYLVRFDKTYTKFIPDLAQSWDEVNSSYVVFHLVKNATFTDGVKVTAQDVKYSFDLALQNWSRLAPYLKEIKSINVIDNYTISFKVTSVPMFMIMGATTVPIVPKHIWDKVKDPATYSDNPPIGSGPLRVAQYKEGEYIMLVKNPNFFRKSWIPYVDKIIISFYSDTSAAANALKAGDIDAVGPYIPRAMIKEFQNDPRFKVIAPPALMYYYLSFDVYPKGLGNPTLRDVRVRQALAHAVNITYLAEMTWDGFAKPIATPVATSNPFHNPYLKPYTFNLTLAREILDKAGYKVGPNGIRISPSGIPLKYTMLVPSNMPVLVRIAQQIANWWKQIGVEATVVPMDTGSMIAKIWVKKGNTTTLGHDIDLWDWFMTPSDPSFLSIFLSNQVPTETSDSGYVNKTYDKLYNELFYAPTMDAAKKIAYKMQEMVYKDLPYIDLFEVSTPQAYSVKFAGFYTDWPGGPFGGYDWTVFLKVRPAGVTTTSSTTSSPSPTATSTTATSPKTTITSTYTTTTTPTHTTTSTSSTTTTVSPTTTATTITSTTTTTLKTTTSLTAAPSGGGVSWGATVGIIIVIIAIVVGVGWYFLKRR